MKQATKMTRKPTPVTVASRGQWPVKTRAFRVWLSAFFVWLLLGGVGSGLAQADGNSTDGNQSADPALQQTVEDNERRDETTEVVISAKHVDIAPQLVDGKWRVLARDDSNYPPVWRPLDKIVFELRDKSVLSLPEGDTYNFTGAKPGDKVFIIPQTEIAGVPWLGWSTQEPEVVKQVEGQVQITFEGHQGEGRFSNFLQEGIGGAPKLLWSDEKSTAQTINVDPNTHVHTNWVFTKLGVHLVRLTFSATLKSGEKVTESVNLRFAIGATQEAAHQLVGEAQKAVWEKVGPDPQAEADTTHNPTSSVSSGWLLGAVGIALLVIGVGAVIVAIVVIRRHRKLKEDAWSAQAEASGPATELDGVNSGRRSDSINDSEPTLGTSSAPNDNTDRESKL